MGDFMSCTGVPYDDPFLRELLIYSMQLGWHLVAVVQYTFTHKQYMEQHN